MFTYSETSSLCCSSIGNDESRTFSRIIDRLVSVIFTIERDVDISMSSCSCWSFSLCFSSSSSTTCSWPSASGMGASFPSSPTSVLLSSSYLSLLVSRSRLRSYGDGFLKGLIALSNLAFSFLSLSVIRISYSFLTRSRINWMFLFSATLCSCFITFSSYRSFA